MTVEPDLAERLRRLQAEIVSPAVWQSRDALEALMTPDFVEFASAGRTYDRTALVEALLGQVPPPIGVEDFTMRQLAPGVALVTYRSVIDRNRLCAADDASWSSGRIPADDLAIVGDQVATPVGVRCRRAP